VADPIGLSDSVALVRFMTPDIRSGRTRIPVVRAVRPRAAAVHCVPRPGRRGCLSSTRAGGRKTICPTMGGDGAHPTVPNPALRILHWYPQHRQNSIRRRARTAFLQLRWRQHHTVVDYQHDIVGDVVRWKKSTGIRMKEFCDGDRATGTRLGLAVPSDLHRHGGACDDSLERPAEFGPRTHNPHLPRPSRCWCRCPTPRCRNLQRHFSDTASAAMSGKPKSARQRRNATGSLLANP